jgi:rhomboid protease GluP
MDPHISSPKPDSFLPVPDAARGDAGTSAAEGSMEQAARQAERHSERRTFRFKDSPATYLLLGANTLVFLIMLPFGPLPAMARAHQFGGMLTAPFDFAVLAGFGGSLASAVLNDHQWWRLFTALFVHVNILHIAVNMWCLWNLGLLGEPLLGRNGLIYTYVITGVAGNLLSLGFAVWTRSDELVVGASGAVFGIAGILIVLLSNRKLRVPWEELKSLRRSVIQFAVLNLVIGLAPQFLLPMAPLKKLPIDLSSLTHIDNSAHLGGFFAGLALGLPLLPRMTAGRQAYRRRQRWVFAAGAFLLVLVGYALAVMSQG